MKRRKVGCLVVLIFLASNLFTCWGTSYVCLRHQDVPLMLENNNKSIFSILIVPDDGKWNVQIVKTWLNKPDGFEWFNEAIDTFYVKMNPETVGHIAYVFRLEKSDKEYINDQLVFRQSF